MWKHHGVGIQNLTAQGEKSSWSFWKTKDMHTCTWFNPKLSVEFAQMHGRRVGVVSHQSLPRHPVPPAEDIFGPQKNTKQTPNLRRYDWMSRDIPYLEVQNMFFVHICFRYWTSSLGTVYDQSIQETFPLNRLGLPGYVYSPHWCCTFTGLLERNMSDKSLAKSLWRILLVCVMDWKTKTNKCEENTLRIQTPPENS